MQNVQTYIDDYAASHQNATNQLIHMICVPVIFFAAVAFGYLIPIGTWLGLSETSAWWANGATLAGLPILGFYASLGWVSFVTGLAWFSVSLIACIALAGMQAPLLWIAISAFVISWIVQFVGHEVEGAKPSFLDDIFFLLIGPLFVQAKLNRLATTGSIYARLG